MLSLKTAIMKEWIDIFVPRGTRNTFFWISCGIIAYNVAFYSAAIIAANLSCIPQNAIWDVTVHGKCFNYKAMEMAGAAINLVSDLIILILPQRVIWTLNMSTSRKLGVSFIFAIGILLV
jgi:hypothetical protein